MRGAEKLIELRKAGRRPSVVFINDYPTPAMYLDGTTVDISGSDLSSVDLRFLVGLTVSTGASTERRAKDILEACKRAGAAVVAVCHVPDLRRDQNNNDYVEVWNGTAH